MNHQTSSDSNAYAGASLIAGAASEGGPDTFHAVNPAGQHSIEPAFVEADSNDVARAAEAAHVAFQVFRQTSPGTRARLLRTIADGIAELGDELFERARLETGLPLARFKGESLRTQGQLKMFASHLESGDAETLNNEAAEPERTPLPKPAIRHQKIPMGPVAVFGASNFPLAFSTAGGDTASALAAGCCVVVKGHPAHPGTSELVAGAIYRALDECDLPAGIFSLIQSSHNDIAAELVRHPAIQAVAFTGSLQGGRAMMDIAAARPDPIPVFAEMGSINPVFLLPDALAERGEDLARGFAQSVTLGEGQFCTNPGLAIGIAGAAMTRFVETTAQVLEQHQPGPMLTSGIHQAFMAGSRALADTEQVIAVSQPADSSPGSAKGRLFQTSAQVFLNHPRLYDEVFGPATLVVICADDQEMQAVAESLAGQLTATLLVNETDREQALALLPALEQRAGRIVFNGYPTGVEVCHGMVHGGPWPASSNSNSTSVGIGALQRFQRPICYQDLPAGWMD